MLGVSQAATIGLHFQPNWTENNAAGYTGFPITATAFGVTPDHWENLTPMPTGYNGSGSAPGPFTLSEVIDTTTKTGGLHPLPQGKLTISWTSVAANTSGFAGNDPGYGGNHPHAGEQEVYYGFLRDDVFVYTHPDSITGYSVQITGLKSLFPTSPYVIQLIASTDSGTGLTNAIVTGAASSQNLTYSATRSGIGIMGGVSSASTALSDDVLSIKGAPALKDETNGVDLASTISGILITDKPLLTVQPKTPAAPFKQGDTAALSVTAIGVPPLQYQWRKDGVAIPGATAATYTVSAVNPANSGHYDVVVSNAYGTVTSGSAAVTGDLLIGPVANVIADTSTQPVPHHGVNEGSTQLASSKDGAGVTRSGVAQFSAAQPSVIRLNGDTNFDSPVGTISFWVRSAGTVVDDAISTGSKGAALFDRRGGSGLLLIQKDDGTLSIQPDGGGNSLTSSATISDNNWHHVAVTYDQSATGTVTLYLDGALDSSNANGNAWSWTVGQPLWLGLSQDGFWRPFDGLMDDFRIYNRILTDTEVASLRTAGSPVVDAAALQVRFDFNSAPSVGYAIDWLNGSLQAATTVTGPYVTIPAVSSPSLVIPAAVPQQAFRTQR